MITLSLTLPSGVKQTLVVKLVEFVLTCPHCKCEFTSPNPRRVFCKSSHKVLFCTNRARTINAYY